ncbi:Solute carrier organic anion transporter [Mactra antiquata]
MEHKEANDTDSNDSVSVEVRCGYGNCRPKSLQKFNNPRMMLFIMSTYVFIQGFIVNGIFNVIISTLERRFHLRSTQMGLAASSYDFSAAIFGVLFSYLGSGRHKPRWLTMSSVCMVLGSVVMASPHFTTDLYESRETHQTGCNVGNSSSVTCKSSGLQHYVGVFALGNIILGMGGATIYTVGTAYIDDSVASITSPLYMGIFFGCSAMGPGLGYLVGGALLNIYVDVDKINPKSLNLQTTDTRWVGAWWIGPIITAVLFLFTTLALSCFGAELPNAKYVRETRESQLHAGTGLQSSTTAPKRPSLKEAHKVLWTLVNNPPFVFTTLAGITEAMFLSGLSVFGAKFAQNAFRISPGKAGILVGCAAIFGLTGGSACGGFLCRCLKLKVKGMLKLAFGVCAVSMLCLPMLTLSCEQTKIAGIHLPYIESEKLSLYNTCNLGCQCSTERFEPVCDTKGTHYFSPCFAGCRTNNSTGDFSNCTCAPELTNITAIDTLSNNGTSKFSRRPVTKGTCESSCNLVYGFLILLFLYIFSSIAADVPAEQAVLRSIHENHKTIMCGANRFFIRLLGTVPGAVIMGVATDSGCLVWQTECNVDTSCWLYDISVVSRNYIIFGCITKILSLIFFFLALWLYRPPTNMDYSIVVNRDSNCTTKTQ